MLPDCTWENMRILGKTGIGQGEKMGSISIRQLALAMCKKSFAELVMYQISTTSYSDLKNAIHEAKTRLHPDIQFELEDIIKNTCEATRDCRFWGKDCGMVLRYFTTMVEKHLTDHFIDTSEKDLIEIFHVIVMHCAYRARKKPRMINFLRETSGQFISNQNYSTQYFNQA